MRIRVPLDDVDDDGGCDVQKEKLARRDAATLPTSVGVDDQAPSRTRAPNTFTAAAGRASPSDGDGNVETTADAAGRDGTTRPPSEYDFYASSVSESNGIERGTDISGGDVALKKKRCEHCGRTTGKSLRGLLSTCSNCEDVYYCGRACQTQDWRRYHAGVCCGMQEIDGLVPKLREVGEAEAASLLVEISPSVKRAEDSDDERRLIIDEQTKMIWVGYRGALLSTGLYVREERYLSTYFVWGVQQGLVLQETNGRDGQH